ncbi:putative alanine and valine rich protein [uncultured Mycobacterium sp.]|uniref:Putative alanine and valine rich protein n=1 Tax=uncultured Mycobacterium sp. TaxID=171292 RepID=A0A1Y5P2H3_9MYCO|nr:putative alanine and valine rich protein [uncultured Mycobacterium sp.]
MPTVTSTVLEIGPATVARSRGSISGEMTAAALAGIDDTTVLFEERPVAVAELWRRVLAIAVETDCESLTVVYPSWWPQHRVALVVDAAATVVTDVRALSRSAVIAGSDPATVVEIADDVVAISAPAKPPVVVSRTDDPGDIAQAIGNEAGARVLIDAPPGVPDAAGYARAVRGALHRRGVVTRLASIGDVPPPASPVEPPAASVPRRWRAPVLAAASVAVTLCAIGVSVSRTHAPAPALDAVDVVEGRVTLRIPSQWTLTRITAGPGSRRIQASSPTEPSVALHVTQSYAPGETLDRTADVLRQAVAEQPAGVFVDFDPVDRRGGRPAVTYREVRVGRDIRWAVVLDGSTRISVGCQSAAGREDTVAEACERAIESARELVGTNRG